MSTNRRLQGLHQRPRPLEAECEAVMSGSRLLRAHTSVVTQLLREAVENRSGGANPSRAPCTTRWCWRRWRFHVPTSVSHLILDYNNYFSLRVSAGSTTSKWHGLEVGVFPGGTDSVICSLLIQVSKIKVLGFEERQSITFGSLAQKH